MLVSVTAQNTMLDRMWATAPGATVESGLLTGDPRTGGVEVSGAGDVARWEGLWVDGVLWDAAPLSDSIVLTAYARVPVSAWGSFWQPASGGVKLSAVVQFTDAKIQHRRSFNSTGI